MDAVAKTKFLPCPSREKTLGRPARSLVTILTNLSKGSSKSLFELYYVLRLILYMDSFFRKKVSYEFRPKWGLYCNDMAKNKFPENFSYSIPIQNSTQLWWTALEMKHGSCTIRLMWTPYYEVNFGKNAMQIINMAKKGNYEVISIVQVLLRIFWSGKLRIEFKLHGHSLTISVGLTM
jgi:hypothetical protein